MTLSLRLLSPGVTRHAALWSPDFPRQKFLPRLPLLPVNAMNSITIFFSCQRKKIFQINFACAEVYCIMEKIFGG